MWPMLLLLLLLRTAVPMHVAVLLRHGRAGARLLACDREHGRLWLADVQADLLAMLQRVRAVEPDVVAERPRLPQHHPRSGLVGAPQGRRLADGEERRGAALHVDDALQPRHVRRRVGHVEPPQRLLLPSTERHRERASRVLVADTGVGQHAPDERTTVRRRRNLPLRLAGVGVVVVRFAARLVDGRVPVVVLRDELAPASCPQRRRTCPDRRLQRKGRRREPGAEHAKG
mmetsp:Transcript_20067/g.65390  ORF Transcript_20067/g.65390 Transcript_20067/m.65390 type:complete len:230 (-) Transcript_20067:6-695(-)